MAEPQKFIANNDPYATLGTQTTTPGGGTAYSYNGGMYTKTNGGFQLIPSTTPNKSVGNVEFVPNAPQPAPTTQATPEQIAQVSKATQDVSALTAKANSLTGGTPAYVSNTTPQIAPVDAKKNQIQQQLDDLSLFVEEPKKRASSSLFEDVKSTLAPTDAPERPNLVKQQETLRTQYGLDPLENELTSVKDQQRQLEDQILSEIGKAKGKAASTAFIGGKIVGITQENADALNRLQSKQATLVDQLNTKYSTVKNIMELSQQDYSNAIKEYDSKFDQAISLYSVLDKERSYRSDAEKEQTTRAKANADTIIKSIKDYPDAFQSPDDETRLNWSKIELQAGLPKGFIEGISKVASEAAGLEYKATIGSAEAGYSAIFMDKNGTPSVVKIQSGTGPKTKVDNLTLAERQRYYPDLPLSLVGLPEQTVIAQLESAAPPQWFVGMQPSVLTDLGIKNAWNKFRDQVKQVQQGQRLKTPADIEDSDEPRY